MSYPHIYICTTQYINVSVPKTLYIVRFNILSYKNWLYYSHSLSYIHCEKPCAVFSTISAQDIRDCLAKRCFFLVYLTYFLF